MSTEEYFEMYQAKQGRIEKALRKIGIYDVDLVSDTMVDLHDWMLANEPKENFVGLFTKFYYVRWLRELHYKNHYEPCDYDTLVRLSDSQQCDDQRAYAQHVAEQVDAILEFVNTHSFRGERCVKTARRIFEMWLQGYTYREMAEAVCSDKGTVRQYLCRMKKNIKNNL